VRDWNEFSDNMTLSYNMGFVGVHEHSSGGTATVILDMLLKFGVLMYNKDENCALHCVDKMGRLYCFGDREIIENSLAFVNKLSNRTLSFEESSLQAKTIVDVFDQIMFILVIGTLA
jgi:hypothetical protein